MFRSELEIYGMQLNRHDTQIIYKLERLLFNTDKTYQVSQVQFKVKISRIRSQN